MNERKIQAVNLLLMLAVCIASVVAMWHAAADVEMPLSLRLSVFAVMCAVYFVSATWLTVYIADFFGLLDDELD
ncbi:MAG: hypothetical protein E6Q97_01575 [Desulfurellales bacterium]|nr:MAG: hypothetical protein E6Q97_01575 [Desulfurellales bacterium]